jgi:hypothetical protein
MCGNPQKFPEIDFRGVTAGLSDEQHCKWIHRVPSPGMWRFSSLPMLTESSIT